MNALHDTSIFFYDDQLSFSLPTALWQVFGLNGAVNIVRVLKERGVQLSFLLDEGLPVIDGVMKGLDGPAAL